MTRFEKILLTVAVWVAASSVVVFVASIRELNDIMRELEQSQPQAILLPEREAEPRIRMSEHPVTVTLPDEAPPEAAPAAPKHKAEFTAFAYCPCEKCCGKWSGVGLTAGGTVPREGRTIAVDPAVIPLGTTVWVDGVEMVAEDTGSGIDGHVIDIFMDSHQAALAWGVRKVTVEWTE